MNYVEKGATDVRPGDLFVGAWADDVFIPSTPPRFVRDVELWEDGSVILNHPGEDGATAVLNAENIALVGER